VEEERNGGIFNMKMTFYVFNDDRSEPPRAYVRCEIDKRSRGAATRRLEERTVRGDIVC
jgi:hypothetical protein